MKPMFKIVAEGNPKQCETSRDFLDLAVQITSYLVTNFQSSDFNEMTQITQSDLNDFLELLQNSQGQITLGDDSISLSLNPETFNLLNRVFWYGRNYGDDITELSQIHDEICRIELT